MGVKISQLPNATGLDSTELVPIVQGGITRQTTIASIIGTIAGTGPKDIKADFGATGDGVTDDHAALQAAADSGQTVFLPPGVYATSATVRLRTTGTKFIGAGNWSGVASPNMTTGTTVIRWIGSAAANSTVVAVSSAAVGTDSSVNLQNVGLSGVTIDGNGIAEIGGYFYRSLSQSNFDYITFTNCKEHNCVVLMCFNATIIGWHSYKALNRGFTLGKNLFGWANSNVDQCTFIGMFGYYSGYDSNTVAQNGFNDITNVEAEYGIGVFNARSLVFINAQAAQCGGAGIFINDNFGGLKFIGGYCEYNGQSTNNSSAIDGNKTEWIAWVNSTSSEWDVDFDGMYVDGTSGSHPPFAFRLTGTQPTRQSAGVTFRRIPIAFSVKADWGRYRLEDCAAECYFTATSPNGFVRQVNGFRNMQITGTITYDTTGGTINNLVIEGVPITAVTYVDTGKCHVALSGTWASARYAILCSGQTGSHVTYESQTVNGFDIVNTNLSTGLPSDGNSRVSVAITSYFTT